MPIPRYDALLWYVVLLTLAFWALGWESGREIAVIAAFHVLGLALELFKVRMGSWSYPGEAWTKVGGVPLYAGLCTPLWGRTSARRGAGSTCG